MFRVIRLAVAVLTASLASVADSADFPEVRLGDTLEQCKARNGEPMGELPYLRFQARDWTIIVHFHEGKADKLTYRKQLGQTKNFTSKGLFALTTTPDPDLNALRKLNMPTNDKSGAPADASGGLIRPDEAWVRIESNVEIIRTGRADQIIANYKPTAAELGDLSQLILPDITWRARDKSLYFSYAVDNYGDEGTLTKSMSVWTSGYQQREDAARKQIDDEA